MQQKMVMRLEIWNVWSIYEAGSMKTAAIESAKYSLDLLAVQEVRWDNSGNQPADDYVFLYGNGNADLQLSATRCSCIAIL
jgi:hypothetical protein